MPTLVVPYRIENLHFLSTGPFFKMTYQAICRTSSDVRGNCYLLWLYNGNETPRPLAKTLNVGECSPHPVQYKKNAK